MPASKLEYGVNIEPDVKVGMRDGVNLAADLYRPAKGGKTVEGKFPAILIRTPYNKETAEFNLDPRFFAMKGYVVVIQDVRGRYKSEGVHYHGVSEADDGYDTIEWIAAQPWSNGKVGMTGLSYLAAVQAAAAVTNPPHLTSLFHVKAPDDYYQYCFRGGGAFRNYITVIVYFMGATSAEGFRDPVLVKSMEEEWEKASEWMTRFPFKKGLTPVNRLPSLEAWLLDMITHTDYDDFWKSCKMWQPVEYYDQYKDISGYYVGSWYDMYSEDRFFAPLTKRLKQPQKLLMGPWSHSDTVRTVGDVDFGPDAEIDYEHYNDLQLRWFDQTLKGMDTGILKEPSVKIFVMGGGSGRKTPEGRLDHGGKWRQEKGWPIARTRYTPYYFHADGSLTPQRSGKPSSSTTYAYDPRDPVPTIGGTAYFRELTPGAAPLTAKDGIPRARMKTFVPYGPYDQRERRDAFGCRTTLPLSSRPDVLVFQTAPLTKPVELTGTLAVKLWGSSSAVDTDFTAKLVDVYPPNIDYPDGYAMNLTDSIIRARYRDGFEKSRLMKPGQTYGFTINLPAVSNLFATGHRIRLDISSSNYPQFDPNPNTGDPYMMGGISSVAKNTIHHDARRPSHIVLPIIPP